LIDDFILKIAKITDGRLEPEAWEGMLDVAAQTATGDEAVETLVRLSKMKISPKKFASQKQCDVFTQYRGYLSMERQAAINEALQQDFVWTKCKVEKSSGQIGIISVVPESGFMEAAAKMAAVMAKILRFWNAFLARGTSGRWRARRAERYGSGSSTGGRPSATCSSKRRFTSALLMSRMFLMSAW
jgi:hypothetical protein